MQFRFWITHERLVRWHWVQKKNCTQRWKNDINVTLRYWSHFLKINLRAAAALLKNSRDGATTLSRVQTLTYQPEAFDMHQPTDQSTPPQALNTSCCQGCSPCMCVSVCVCVCLNAVGMTASLFLSQHASSDASHFTGVPVCGDSLYR